MYSLHFQRNNVNTSDVEVVKGTGGGQRERLDRGTVTERTTPGFEQVAGYAIVWMV